MYSYDSQLWLPLLFVLVFDFVVCESLQVCSEGLQRKTRMCGDFQRKLGMCES